MLGFCAPCVAAAGGSSLLAPFERVRDGAAAVVNIPRERRAFLESLFRELEALKPGESYEAVQRSLLTLILVEVNRAMAEAGQRTARGGGVVVDALRFIERNCLRSITPRDVAAAVKRSPAYITTALKQATGRSAGEWIIAGRLAEARRLLLHSGERVEIIAERVGYADPTHFIRIFRREHGATPAAWRNAQSPPLQSHGATIRKQEEHSTRDEHALLASRREKDVRKASIIVAGLRAFNGA